MVRDENMYSRCSRGAHSDPGNFADTFQVVVRHMLVLVRSASPTAKMSRRIGALSRQGLERKQLRLHSWHFRPILMRRANYKTPPAPVAQLIGDVCKNLCVILRRKAIA